MSRKLIVVVPAVVAMGAGVLSLMVAASSPRPLISPAAPVRLGLPPQTGPPPPRLQVSWHYAEITIDLGWLGGLRSRNLVIPFWALFALFSICLTVVLLRVPLWWYRRHKLVMATLSFWVSVFTIFCTLNAIPHVVGARLNLFRMLRQLLGSEGVALALVLALPLGASYAVARTVFSTLGRPSGVTTGFCQTCGYDLTGNASGVCPECGAEVARHD